MNRALALILACQLSLAIAVDFHDSGAEVGIEMWRVDSNVVPGGFDDDYIRTINLDTFNSQVAHPTPLSPAEANISKFDSGHVYIVVNTVADNVAGGLARIAHFWVGKNAPLAKRLAAVFHVANFWLRFEKEPLIYREGETAESNLFQAYSTLGPVKPEDVPKDVILYQVKGEEVPLVIQVPANARHLQLDDCFILDSPNNVLVYKGTKANDQEDNATDRVGQFICSFNHGPSHSVDLIHRLDNSDAYFNLFLHLTGEDPQTFEYTSSSTSESDAAFEIRRNNEIQLFEVTDKRGSVTVTKVNKNARLRHNMLNSEECYLLNTASMFNIFAWIGNGATEKEVVNVLQEAEKSISHEELSKKVTVIRQNEEPLHFLLNFYDFLYNDDE